MEHRKLKSEKNTTTNSNNNNKIIITITIKNRRQFCKKIPWYLIKPNVIKLTAVNGSK
jgi:hypothetical protein